VVGGGTTGGAGSSTISIKAETITLDGDVTAIGSNGGNVYGTAGRGGDSMIKGGAGGVVGIAGAGGKGGTITIKAELLIAMGTRVVDAHGGNGGTQYGTGGDGGNASAAIPTSQGGKGGAVNPPGAGGGAGDVAITAPKKSGVIKQTEKAGDAGLQKGHAGNDGQRVPPND
jgi:hypothetical protein